MAFGATVGSTSTGAKDDLQALGIIAKRENMTLLVDAAYLGNSFFLPEMRVPGIENADVLAINFSKNMLIGNAGTMMFVRNRKKFLGASIMNREKFTIYG